MGRDLSSFDSPYFPFNQTGCELVGRNLYPYTIRPRSPLLCSTRVVISTSIPIFTSLRSTSVSCAVINGPSSSFTSATVYGACSSWLAGAWNTVLYEKTSPRPENANGV